MRQDLVDEVRRGLRRAPRAAYEPMGSTMEGARAIFERPHAPTRDVHLRISREGFRFRMWDGRACLMNEVKAFWQ